MDIVYICRNGNNEELRYSIRSVIKNMPLGNIWVVGGKPDWYCGNYIEVPQSAGKYRNARNSLQAIVESKSISENFVLMNDDFFVIKPVSHVEYFHGGPLINKIDTYEDMTPRSSYTLMLKQTHERLVKLGIREPLDYDIHVPMPMTKTGLSKSIKGNTLWRSTYGNIFSVGGTEIADVKLYHGGPLKIKNKDYSNIDSPYLSTDDESFSILLKDTISSMFPEPTELEADLQASSQEHPFALQTPQQPLLNASLLT